jgi:hypothetical protein
MVTDDFGMNNSVSETLGRKTVLDTNSREKAFDDITDTQFIRQTLTGQAYENRKRATTDLK